MQFTRFTLFKYCETRPCLIPGQVGYSWLYGCKPERRLSNAATDKTLTCRTFAMVICIYQIKMKMQILCYEMPRE
jgi:hypothetical protein